MTSFKYSIAELFQDDWTLCVCVKITLFELKSANQVKKTHTHTLILCLDNSMHCKLARLKLKRRNKIKIKYLIVVIIAFNLNINAFSLRCYYRLKLKGGPELLPDTVTQKVRFTTLSCLNRMFNASWVRNWIQSGVW